MDLNLSCQVANSNVWAVIFAEELQSKFCDQYNISYAVSREPNQEVIIIIKLIIFYHMLHRKNLNAI